jgi:hypothetical protein
MRLTRSARHFAIGVVAGIVAGVLALIYGPITWTAALLFVVLSGVLMPRFAYLSGALLALGGTWLVLMITLNTPRPFLVVPLVLLAAGLGFAYWTFIRRRPITT